VTNRDTPKISRYNCRPGISPGLLLHTYQDSHPAISVSSVLFLHLYSRLIRKSLYKQKSLFIVRGRERERLPGTFRVLPEVASSNLVAYDPMDWMSIKSSIWPTAAAAGPDLYKDDDSISPFYSSSTSTTPPTSQPPTPPHGSDGLTMQTTSPINIATPTRNASSSPPSQGKTANYHGVEDSRTSAMMCGSGHDPNGRTRQDSFGGAKPISMNNPRNAAERPRRESLAGSLVGGMSWGGVSVGSWIRDE